MKLRRPYATPLARTESTRRAILTFIGEHQPTTFREVATGVGMPLSSARHHLFMLKRLGAVTWDEVDQESGAFRRSRTIRLIRRR